MTTSGPQKVGHDAATASDLWWWQVRRADDLRALPSTGRPFVCLLWWDAPDRSAATAVAEISTAVTAVLRAGCVWFCCHGRNCTLVEDIADEWIVGDGTVDPSDDAPPTTSHDEPLEKAIVFWLRDAFGSNRGIDRVCLRIGPVDTAARDAFLSACAEPAAFAERYHQ